MSITIVKGIVGVLIALFAAFLIKWLCKDPNIKETPQKLYDVIIVGAGTAGSILARRLSDITDIHVLLVEAGESTSWLSDIPLFAPFLQLSSANWNYRTKPQKHSMSGLINKQSAWPRGRVLGGSSTINYFLHNWGIKEDFDLWPKEWNYDNAKKYFLRSEDYHSISRNDTAHRGKHGKLKVTEFEVEKPSLAQAFMEGADELGLSVGDLNNLQKTGVMPSQNNIYEGKRWSSYKGYLQSIGKRNNLDITTGYVVIKILFKGSFAIGAEMLSVRDGKVYRVYARKEVILCAGVIESPHLLLLSGIGPAEQLKKFKISVMSNISEVGQQLEDHLNIPLYFSLEKPLSINFSKVKSFLQLWNYLIYGSGLLSRSGVDAVARAFGSDSSNSTRPEFFFILFSVGSINEEVFGKISNFQEKIFLQSFPDIHNESKEGFIILASCLHPFSKGYVTLKSSDPLEPPIIDPQYLSDDRDIKCLVDAMKMAAKLGTTKPLLELGSRLHYPKFHNCIQFKQSIENDEYLKCWLQTNGITGNHPLGTNRMGGMEFTVLDPELRVRGIHNLRVVDGSSIPGQLSAPPNAAIVMLAEKAADLIISSLLST